MHWQRTWKSGMCMLLFSNLKKALRNDFPNWIFSLKLLHTAEDSSITADIPRCSKPTS
jgi:ABC-type uncharacterized transport system YnjBCD ATPase subunit